MSVNKPGKVGRQYEDRGQDAGKHSGKIGGRVQSGGIRIDYSWFKKRLKQAVLFLHC
jgi:hypothetical protein